MIFYGDFCFVNRIMDKINFDYDVSPDYGDCDVDGDGLASGGYVFADDRNIVKFIDLVKSRTWIYDLRDKNHSDRVAVANAWDEIGKHMNTDARSCKTKWQSLRTAFTREKKSRHGLNGTKLKKWKFYDQLKFLNNHITTQESKRMSKHQNNKNAECGQPMEILTSMVELQDSSIFCPSTSQSSVAIAPPLSPTISHSSMESLLEIKKRKREINSNVKEEEEEVKETLNVVFKKYLEAQTKAIEINKVKEEPNDSYFFNHLCAQIQAFPERKREFFKLELFNLYLDFKFNRPDLDD